MSRAPVHVGVVMDGNRRWARAAGLTNVSHGHRAGAQHVEDLLAWCVEAGIEHVTTYVLSADNIRKRPAHEVGFLFDLLAGELPSLVERSEQWSLHVSGDLEMLPPDVRGALTGAVRTTAGRARHLTMAIAYDGRADIVGAIRAAMRDGADASDPEAITAHLGGGPVKEIDLVIRTSGEHRLSGFFPWQTAHAEVYVCSKPWPAFGRDDFLEALRHYSDRADPERHAAS
ncbi:polyprenyl diphosphate synthase [Nocardioides sp.]|uniref:polyprenyl diphosphate synthase n=1 Tax=Nocardioides sp. TaxID=35761 RepID=UPI002B5B85A8|nr:polyprenyl diphosphate synthase [Nocardioides sp.]HXH80431.1 polyprenyl diphosphate synthase [Nocardioides sp.]